MATLTKNSLPPLPLKNTGLVDLDTLTTQIREPFTDSIIASTRLENSTPTYSIITEENILENYLKIRKELIKYSSNLLKKKEIIVFNKIDIINIKEIEEKINNFKKKIKKNIYKISVTQNKGLITIRKLLVKNVYR